MRKFTENLIPRPIFLLFPHVYHCVFDPKSKLESLVPSRNGILLTPANKNSERKTATHTLGRNGSDVSFRPHNQAFPSGPKSFENVAPTANRHTESSSFLLLASPNSNRPQQLGPVAGSRKGETLFSHTKGEEKK